MTTKGDPMIYRFLNTCQVNESIRRQLHEVYKISFASQGLDVDIINPILDQCAVAVTNDIADIMRATFTDEEFIELTQMYQHPTMQKLIDVTNTSVADKITTSILANIEKNREAIVEAIVNATDCSTQPAQVVEGKVAITSGSILDIATSIERGSDEIIKHHNAVVESYQIPDEFKLRTEDKVVKVRFSNSDSADWTAGVPWDRIGAKKAQGIVHDGQIHQNFIEYLPLRIVEQLVEGEKYYFPADGLMIQMVPNQLGSPYNGEEKNIDFQTAIASIR